jgi:phosphopantetheine adenylyltransferase
MISPEKNLYISNDFDFFTEENIVLDEQRVNIFLTDTNITAQLKTDELIKKIYNSNIIKFSKNLQKIKDNLNNNSHIEFITCIKDYLSDNSEDDLNSILVLKKKLNNFMDELIDINSKKNRKYVRYPLEILHFINETFITQQKEYIKEVTKSYIYNENESPFLSNILLKYNNIRFVQANLASNFESFLSQSGEKGEPSLHKIHSYNHFTLSFINNSILETILENNQLECVHGDNYFYLLYRYHEINIRLLFNQIKNEFLEVMQEFSNKKSFTFKKNQLEVVNFIETKNYHFITLIMLEYILNYNYINQNFSKDIIAKKLEGIGANGITHEIKYQNTILDLIFLFLSLCFFKKENFKIFFVTNDQGYIYLNKIYGLEIPQPKNMVIYTEDGIRHTNLPNHILKIKHNDDSDKLIKLIKTDKEYIIIPHQIKQKTIDYYNNKKFIT